MSTSKTFTPSAELAALMAQLMAKKADEQAALRLLNMTRSEREAIQETASQLHCQEQWGFTIGDTVEWQEQWGYGAHAKTVTRHGIVTYASLWDEKGIDSVNVRLLRADGTTGYNSKTLWLANANVTKVERGGAL